MLPMHHPYFLYTIMYTIHLPIQDFQPLHPQLYKMDPRAFFLPSFLEAIRGNTIHHFNDIIHEPTPKVYTFPMLRPAFCEMLMNEVHITWTILFVPS
jgi:hypothetical protein